jgi:hypothetical protein
MTHTNKSTLPQAHRNAQPPDGYLRPSRPSTRSSGVSTGSHPRQTAENQASNVPGSTDMNPPTMQAEENPSTPSLRPSAVLRPHDDADQDPFAPRPTYFQDRWEITPILKYFVRRDPMAEKEYLLLAPAVTSILRELGYNSYCVTFIHIGYELETSHPCILVIAPDFADKDAELVLEFVRTSRERCTIARAFAYSGSFHGHQLGLETFQQHQQNPLPGSSIGSSALPSLSFSLNCYFVAADQDDSQIYALSVHHGISEHPESIPLNAETVITISQPSRLDYEHMREECLHAIEQLNEPTEAPRPGAHQKMWAMKLEENLRDLKALDKLDIKFGAVVASSGLGRVVWDGRLHNEDWALIAVDPEREGVDYMRTDSITAQEMRWTPHDRYGQYLAGVGVLKVLDENLDDSAEVRKWGSNTGVTDGPISALYSHVKLPGIPGETNEFTVTTASGPASRFSDRGDSGAPAVDMRNHLVGMVLGGTEGKPVTLIGHERLGAVLVLILPRWNCFYKE